MLPSEFLYYTNPSGATVTLQSHLQYKQNMGFTGYENGNRNCLSLSGCFAEGADRLTESRTAVEAAKPTL